MEEKVITITLKTPEWNIVLNALGSRPYGEVVALIGEIQRQATDQLNSAVTPPEE